MSIIYTTNNDQSHTTTKKQETEMENVKVKLLSNMQFLGTNEDGLPVMMDASPNLGGENKGVRPMELLLISLAGCSGMDVISILRKKKQDITSYEINVSGERREEHPRIFTKIKVEHVVRGKNIDPKAVERAVQLSTDTYCSVIGMLRQSAHIEVGFRIEESAI